MVYEVTVLDACLGVAMWTLGGIITKEVTDCIFGYQKIECAIGQFLVWPLFSIFVLWPKLFYIIFIREPIIFVIKNNRRRIRIK